MWRSNCFRTEDAFHLEHRKGGENKRGQVPGESESNDRERVRSESTRYMGALFTMWEWSQTDRWFCKEVLLLSGKWCGSAIDHAGVRCFNRCSAASWELNFSSWRQQYRYNKYIWEEISSGIDYLFQLFWIPYLVQWLSVRSSVVASQSRIQTWSNESCLAGRKHLTQSQLVIGIIMGF